MQQEMIHKEIEFGREPPKKYLCFDCNKEFNHIEKCKDGKNRCKNCKKKIPTNKFYNPNYGKRKEFVGIKNLSYQERKILVQKYINKGFSPYQAKNKVEYDLSVIKGIKIKKIEPEQSSSNLNIQKKDRAMTNELIKGLGMKK